MISKSKLLDKCEAMTLLCTKASSHWSLVKFCFNIPLVFTSSAMCIINSISTDANNVKVANIVVNAISVLIMSLSNSIKASEKLDLFHRLSLNFMSLSCEIENTDNDLTTDEMKLLHHKYETLIQSCCFEEIPNRYKQQTIDIYKNRYLPIQLNGTIGNVSSNRSSRDNIELNNIV